MELTEAEAAFLRRYVGRQRRTWQQTLDGAASHKQIERRERAAYAIKTLDALDAKLAAEQELAATR